MSSKLFYFLNFFAIFVLGKKCFKLLASFNNPVSPNDLTRDKGRRKEHNLKLFHTNLQTALRHQVYDGYIVYGGLLGM